MIELKRCPLCGADGQMKDVHVKIRQGWVGCPECGLYIHWNVSPEGAIKKWNRRDGVRLEREEKAIREQYQIAMMKPMPGLPKSKMPMVNLPRRKVEK